MAETKAYNEVFHYIRDNEYPIDFSKIRKEIHVRKSKNSFLKLVRCRAGHKNGQLRRWVHSRDKQQQITESLSL